MLDLRDEREALPVTRLRRRRREAHVLEVTGLLEGGDEVGRGPGKSVERQTAGAEVERREVGVGRNDVRELLQQDRDATLLSPGQDVELVAEVADLVLQRLHLADLRRHLGLLVADLPAKELVLHDRAAAPDEEEAAEDGDEDDRRERE